MSLSAHLSVIDCLMTDSKYSHENPFCLSFTYATHNPALLILKEKGYQLEIILDEEGDGSTFVATGPGRRFAANGGAELLGLVTVWEHFGIQWSQREPDLMNELIQENLEE